jgi:hypothetical protein
VSGVVGGGVALSRTPLPATDPLEEAKLKK